MDSGRVLRQARRRAGLTQRELARRAGVAQPTVARIESGTVVPRVDTLDGLLEECGEGLYSRERIGLGLDRDMIRASRRGTPTARSRAAEEEAPYAAGRRLGRSDNPNWQPELALRVLERHQVRFIVIGGYAARLHGSPTVTNDTDIVYERTRENIKRLARALDELDASLSGPPPGAVHFVDERMLRNGQNFTFVTDAGRFDCLAEPAGIQNFEQLDANAEDLEISGMMVRVASVADLIAMKTAAGRAKDRIEVEVLGALQEEIDREN